MVYKTRHRSGKVAWAYRFELPGSTATKRVRAWAGGFTTKKKAGDAEAERRIEEKAKAKAPVKTLGLLIQEFLIDSENLASKTLERYKELAAYLSPALLDTPIAEVTPLVLHQEWRRLAESGGRTRKDKKARPLSPKTVRHICGVVSSAFGRARRWGLVPANPAEVSDPPKIEKREGIAMSPEQVRKLSASATIPWESAFIELAAASGLRRGELLALEWGDIEGDCLYIRKSLSQTKGGLQVKRPKTDRTRELTLPASALSALRAHRKQQDVYREHFGSDYAGDLIFAGHDGTPLKPDSVSSAISALCKRLKMPKGISLHTLRHTHGSQLVAAGVPITDVARRLGHANAQTTLTVYAHALPDRDEATARAWEEFQGKEVKVTQ